MTCEKCYHNEVCQALYELNGIPRIGATECAYFRDKDRLLELACMVGDPVFVIPTKENGRKEITPMTCLGFYIDKPCNTANCVDEKNKSGQGRDRYGR